jgi:hypothetical protein
MMVTKHMEWDTGLSTLYIHFVQSVCKRCTHITHLQDKYLTVQTGSSLGLK